MILVTGAAGKTGRAIIRSLADKGQAIRALVHRPEQEVVVINAGAQQVMTGDLADKAAVVSAVEGVKFIYHICPNVDPDEVAYAKLLINTAVSAGVSHFGYHSVLHPQTEQMVHHWQKLKVEELLFQSGLRFTIMQPSAYMQNVLAQSGSILKHGVLQVPYSLSSKLSLVDLEDVAAAVATVITEPGHEDAIYELAGSEALDHRQIAETLQEVLTVPVSAKEIELASWASDARRGRLGEYQVKALTAMFTYYDQFGLRGNPSVLTFLLGRRPTTFEVAARRELVD